MNWQIEYISIQKCMEDANKESFRIEGQAKKATNIN